MIRAATTGFHETKHASTLYKFTLLSLSYVIEYRQQGRCVLQERSLRFLQMREATQHTAFPSLSQLFPSVYIPETYIFLVFECSPQFRSQNLSLSLQHLISSFKHRNVKYFGVVLAFQNISWARTLWVTKKEAHGNFSASLLHSQYFGTHSGRSVEVYSTHIHTLFEAWTQIIPCLFQLKFESILSFSLVLSPCTEVFITEAFHKYKIFQSLRI